MPPKSGAPAIERPPYLTFAEALRVIVQIHELGGGSLSFESLSPVLGNSLKSSSFARKVSALRNFGLVEASQDRVVLSRLGQAYTAPTSSGEKAMAMYSALLNVPLAKMVHERFAGGVLPSLEQLGNLLLREFQVPQDISSEWATFILEGFRTSELISSTGGRTTLRARPEEASPFAQDQPTMRPQAATHVSRPEEPPALPLDGTIKLTFPLDGGKQAVVLLPREASEHDLDDMIDLLTVMKKRAARAALDS